MGRPPGRVNGKCGDVIKQGVHNPAGEAEVCSLNSLKQHRLLESQRLTDPAQQ